MNLVLDERHEHGERHEPGDDLQSERHGHLVASETVLLAVIIGIDGAIPEDREGRCNRYPRLRRGQFSGG